MLAQEGDEVRAGVENVALEQVAGGLRRALPAQSQQPAMLLLGTLDAACQQQLQAQIAVGVVVEILHQGKTTRPVGRTVEGGMEFPVELSPDADVRLVEGR